MNPSSHNQRAVHHAKLLSIDEVAPAHYQIRLLAPVLAKSALPGQFVHICTTPNSTEFTFEPLLRRAFSIMSVATPEKNAIDVLFRVEGRGTQSLARARVNDEIDLIGPLGQPFDVSPLGVNSSDSEAVGVGWEQMNSEMFHVKQSASRAIVVGGGVGVPPLVYLSQYLKSAGIEVAAIIGARTSSDVVGSRELSESCRSVAVTTDDGSQGHHGRVTDLLISLVEKKKKGENEVAPIVYACGPLPMLRAVAQLCATHQVRCQVSLEENMPCGIGVCNGCVVRASQAFTEKQNDNEGEKNVNQIVGNEWSPYRAYRRVCVEGPACWADEIDWEYQG